MATAPSFTSDATSTKKDEGYSRAVVAAEPSSGLPAINDEDEGDEAEKVAGEVAQVFTEEEQNAVRRKIDRRIVPLLMAVYFSQFLDKNSINYSSVMGLPITGEHYNLCAMAFYLGFLLFEMPQSALAARFPRAKYLGVQMLCWSAALWLHSASGLWGVFFLFRFLLGAFECVVSPVLIGMVASWYKKSEQSTRIASFYCANGITQIVGGAIAYGITHYQGTAVSHWRIIYLVLGSMALIVTIAVLIWLPDSPATATFLTPREREIALERVRGNASGVASYAWKPDQAREALTDPKVGILCLLMAMICVPNSAITSFTSILLKAIGYTSQEALIMNMPCGAVAIVTTLTICIVADKYNKRMLPLLLSVIPSVVGMALLVAYSRNGAKGQPKGPLLAGILLSQCFVSGISLIYSWSACNIGGSTKKAVVNGMLLISFGGGNLAGSQAFQATDAPQYLPGKLGLLILLCAIVPGCLFLHWYVGRLNKAKAAEVARLVQENGWTDEDLQREKDRLAFKDLTDKQNPFFVYIR